jgi:putative hydrolase of the HAD superfamily
MKAVVFDLFGTLVTYPSGSPHVRAMAERLGVSFDLLRAAWRRLRAQRDAGELDTQAALRICCNELGIDRSDQDIEAACAEVVEFFRAVLSARDGAISTLTALRARHMRIGLVSDANLEVAKLWSSTTLAPLVDAAVFSCAEHVRKPDPALYRAVCERLGVAASDCLYVGNGDGQELAGALTAGMRAVLFTAPGEFAGREAADWTGDRISSLAQVLPFTLVSVTVR